MSDETIITTTDTEETSVTSTSTTSTSATVSAAPVPMKRDFRKGGKGVTRMLVQPSQVADFEKAGWYRA